MKILAWIAVGAGLLLVGLGPDLTHLAHHWFPEPLPTHAIGKVAMIGEHFKEEALNRVEEPRPDGNKFDHPTTQPVPNPLPHCDQPATITRDDWLRAGWRGDALLDKLVSTEPGAERFSYQLFNHGDRLLITATGYAQCGEPLTVIENEIVWFDTKTVIANGPGWNTFDP